MIHLGREFLDGVGKGVAEVELAAFATLTLIAIHDVGLDLDSCEDNLAQEVVVVAQLVEL